VIGRTWPTNAWAERTIRQAVEEEYKQKPKQEIDAAKARANSGTPSTHLTDLEREIISGDRHARGIWMIPDEFQKYLSKEVSVEADQQKGLAKYNEHLKTKGQ
jgi:hypothetical protein